MRSSSSIVRTDAWCVSVCVCEHSSHRLWCLCSTSAFAVGIFRNIVCRRRSMLGLKQRVFRYPARSCPHYIRSIDFVSPPVCHVLVFANYSKPQNDVAGHRKLICEFRDETAFELRICLRDTFRLLNRFTTLGWERFRRGNPGVNKIIFPICSKISMPSQVALNRNFHSNSSLSSWATELGLDATQLFTTKLCCRNFTLTPSQSVGFTFPLLCFCFLYRSNLTPF